MVDAVPNFRESPLFTPAEKAAMTLADAMAGAHTKIAFEPIFAEMRKHYSEEQIVELGWARERVHRLRAARLRARRRRDRAVLPATPSEVTSRRE